MKAVILNKIGTIGDLEYKYIADPQIKKDEVLIKVAYCGVNHLDLHIVSGARVGPKVFPHILGSEIVGEIDGDRMAVYPWMYCGKCKQCRSGLEQLCDFGGTLGRMGWGGYAEYSAVPIKNLIKIPDQVAEEMAAGSILAGSSALHLIRRANIPDKSTVLITGATGGVGTMAIQILKNKKCFVIGTTSRKEKEKKLYELGCDLVVDTRQFEDILRKKYPQGLDFIIDIMGGEIWSRGVRLLAKNGTIVFCATSVEGLGEVDIASAFSRQINILGSYGGSMEDMKDILKLLVNGKIKPVIDSVYPLKEARQALKKLTDQKSFGKILLRV